MKKIYLLILLVLTVFFANTSNATDRNVGPGQTYATIQAAIDASIPGDVIKVYPGIYNTDEANGYDPVTGGAGSNDFNIFVNKGITIQGVNAFGIPITNYSDIVGHVVAKRNLPTFGCDAIYVQADNVTITGLEITGFNAPASNNKTVETSGDNVIIKYCKINAIDQTASIYITDNRYNPTTNVSHVQAYRIEGNYLDAGGPDPNCIRISSGPGWTGSISNRVITGNVLYNSYDALAFVGPGGEAWDLYPVGAAIITNNTFSLTAGRQVIAWGVYNSAVGYGTLDWNGIIANNTFDKAAVVKTPSGDIRSYSSGVFANIRWINTTIQSPINKAQSGDNIQVLPGTYEEQLEISIPLTINGAGNTTIIKSPVTLTKYFTTSANNYPVVYVHDADNVVINNLKVDGAGRGNTNNRFNGIAYFNAGGTMSNCTITDIRDNPISGAQHGVGVYGYADVGSDRVINFNSNTIVNFQKNATVFYGSKLTANVTNNIITGAGAINFTAQNGIQVSSVASANVTGNTVTGFSYIPSTYTATGILIYGPNVGAITVSNNTVSQSQTGIYFINANGTISNNDVSLSKTGIGTDYCWAVVADPGLIFRVPLSPFDELKKSYLRDKLMTTYSVSILNNMITVTGNPISSAGLGIYTGDASETMNATATQNTISGFYVGVDVYKVGGSTINAELHNNSISGNTYNVYSSISEVVNATNNWWGTAIESEILAKLFGPVTYDPWIGKLLLNLPVSVTSTPIDLPGTGATIQFSHIGSNNVNPTISVQRIDGLPNTPASAGTPIPVYLQITPINLANYTFEATIVLDVSTIPGFDANTIVMMSPNGTTGWVASNGIYDAGAHTYTFTTNHFSTIAFVNPLLANEVNLYVSTSTTTYDNTVYPNISWNTQLTTVPDGFDWNPANHEPDWTYKVKTGTFYIIPTGVRSFNDAHIKIIWNPSLVSGVTVTRGTDNLFDGSFFFSTSSGSNWVIINASNLTGNKTPDGHKYLAKLDFAFDGTESGFSAIAIDEVTLLYMDGSYSNEATPVTQNMGGKFKCYLGDFASDTPLPPLSSQETGDGLINGTDLMPGFSSAYWSHYNDTSTLYKSKYDIGPTTPARYYYGKPTPDGTIGFEDLAIFAMGYSKTASGTLPDNPKPIIFSLDKISNGANGTLRLPVKISGSVNDLRAYSMKLNYSSDMEYKGVEMAGEMLEGTNFLIGKSETGKVFTDGASFGKSLSKEGIIAYVLFTEKTAGNHFASIESVIARNSGNLDLEVNFAEMNSGVGIPKTFSLNQNYPNPFNPVTKIEYALPKDVKVSIKIYDMLGREVSVLVNDMQKAGYYKIDWNGSSLASGAYFYKMVAGDFVAVKKMLMIK